MGNRPLWLANGCTRAEASYGSSPPCSGAIRSLLHANVHTYRSLLTDVFCTWAEGLIRDVLCSLCTHIGHFWHILCTLQHQRHSSQSNRQIHVKKETDSCRERYLHMYRPRLTHVCVHCSTGDIRASQIDRVAKVRRRSFCARQIFRF